MPILSVEVLVGAAAPIRRGTCAACGCTDSSACPDGCAWVNEAQTICSACIAPALRRLVLRKHGIGVILDLNWNSREPLR